jgi:hypothetical protein
MQGIVLMKIADKDHRIRVELFKESLLRNLTGFSQREHNLFIFLADLMA